MEKMIDKIPQIGRFLFRESMLRDGFFHRAGIITRIAGKRVYYNDRRESAVPDERFIHVRSVTAVCDTTDEIDVLTAFNRRALDEINELKVAHAVEALTFFTNGTQG